MPATPRSWSTKPPASGLAALAVTDHNGFYGIVRFAVAAKSVGLPTVFGTELTLLDGSHLVCSPTGRSATPASPGRSAGASSRGRRRRPASTSARSPRTPGRQSTSPATTPERANDSWIVLTGCRQGAVPRALLADGPAAARRALDRLVAAFGRDRVLVELWDHGDPLDRHRNDALATARRRASAST